MASRRAKRRRLSGNDQKSPASGRSARAGRGVTTKKASETSGGGGASSSKDGLLTLAEAVGQDPTLAKLGKRKTRDGPAGERQTTVAAPRTNGTKKRKVSPAKPRRGRPPKKRAGGLPGSSKQSAFWSAAPSTTWTAEDDKLLGKLAKHNNFKNWKRVAQHFPGRTSTQCSQHWRKCADPSVKKNKKWDQEEDAALLRLRMQESPLSFGEIALTIPGRTNIQCRNRWDNVVNPAIRNGGFSADEDMVILELRGKNERWVDMTKNATLKGRSSISLKNRHRRLLTTKGRNGQKRKS